MPLVSDIYSSRWLSGADLNNPTPGVRRRAVIVAITAEPVGQKQEPEIVADLAAPSGARWPKRWIIGRTRSAVLAMDYGPDYGQWVGKGVELWAENRLIQGVMKPVIACVAYHTETPRAPGNGALPPPEPPQTMQMGPHTTVPIPQGSASPAQPGKIWAGPGSELDDEIPL